MLEQLLRKVVQKVTAKQSIRTTQAQRKETIPHLKQLKPTHQASSKRTWISGRRNSTRQLRRESSSRRISTKHKFFPALLATPISSLLMLTEPEVRVLSHLTKKEDPYSTRFLREESPDSQPSPQLISTSTTQEIQNQSTI